MTFFKNISILIITSLAIHYSQHVFRGFSILVCKGVQVFFCGFFLFFTPLLVCDSLSCFPRPCLRLTEEYWKISPVLQIQTSSMKLRVCDCLFLVFLHIKTDGKNKLSFYSHIHFQIRRFFSELVKSDSCEKFAW